MNDFFVSLMLLGAASTGGESPFWATANQYNIVPYGNGATMLLQSGCKYDSQKTLQWEWGLSAGVSTDSFRPVRFLPDEAYAGIKWKFLSLEAGLKRRQQDFLAVGGNLGTISTTGGNMLWSGNAPTMPGYTFTVHKVAIPGTNGHLSLFGRFADYSTIDNRYVKWAHVHNSAAGVQFGFTSENRYLLTLALDHYAMWGGTHPEMGRLEMSASTYFRMLLGLGAKAGGTYHQMDVENVIGNQLGHILIRFDYKGDKWSLAFQHDHPYEDKSGMYFKNFPDGVNTLSLSFADRKMWVSDILYEFQYTLYQGGTCERRDATEAEIASNAPGLYRNQDGTYSLIVGGADDYFVNGEYMSGWTHGSAVIGNPLFYPAGTLKGTYVPGAMLLGVENNRLMAHHLGISGMLFGYAPYKLMLTHTLNYGRYRNDLYAVSIWKHPWSDHKLQKPLVQFSGGFQCEIPMLGNSFYIIPAIFWDRGKVLGNRLGMTLGVKYLFTKDFRRR